MSVITLDDHHDGRISVYRALKLTNETRSLGQFVVEGMKLVESLSCSRFPVVSVLTDDKHAERAGSLVSADVPVYVLPESAIADVVGYRFHLGALAAGERVPWPQLDEIVPRKGPALVLACPHLDNPDNLGALVRTADAFGAAAIIVGPRSPDPLSRRVLRVSMGSSLTVPVIECSDTAATAARLRDESGCTIVAAVTAGDGEPIRGFEAPSRLVLLLGNETHGLDEASLRLATRRVTVPMREGADSLNVAMAAGILLYEITGGGSRCTGRCG